MVELQESEVTEQVENVTPPATAGALLRQAREAAGMHVLTLAETLKVPAAKLEALEADDWQALPDKVFTRSLALGVCKALHIDAAPVLALLPKSDAAQRFTAPGPGINEPFRHKAVRSVHDTPNKGIPWKWVALVVVVAVAAGAWHFAGQQDVRDAVVASVHERSQRAMGTPGENTISAPVSVGAGVAPASSVEAPAAVAVPPAAPVSAPESVPAAPAVAPVPAAVPVNPAMPAPVVAVAPAEPVAAAAPDAAVSTPAPTATSAAPAQPASASGTPVLRIQVTAPTWVQVRSHGKVLEQKTLNAGEVLETQASKPLSVVVGRADAATVQVDGAAFDLAAVTRVNVARFEVK